MITDEERDISFSMGFLEEWLKDAPSQIHEHLKIISDAIDFYRQKYTDAQEDAESIRDKYNQLTALTSQYLQHIQQQKETIDQLLSEQQKSYKTNLDAHNLG
jgi:uncharacterized coiled-coil DUF342 family protein